VRQNAERADVAEQIAAVRRDSNEPQADVERVVEILLSWIAEDRKAAAQALQGMVWAQAIRPGSSKATSTRTR
jgi:enolase-phosphatase E1